MKTTTGAGALAIAMAVAGIGAAHAQYPVRPVRIIVPFAAGSVNDTVARFAQPQLSAALGQQVVIDNRAGAAGNLGAEGDPRIGDAGRARAFLAAFQFLNRLHQLAIRSLQCPGH